MRPFGTRVPLPAPGDLAARYPFLALPPTHLRPRNPNLVPLPPRATGARQPLPLPGLMPVSLRTPAPPAPAPRPAAPMGPRLAPRNDPPAAAPPARPPAPPATMSYLYRTGDGRVYEVTGRPNADLEEVRRAVAAELARRASPERGPAADPLPAPGPGDLLHDATAGRYIRPAPPPFQVGAAPMAASQSPQPVGAALGLADPRWRDAVVPVTPECVTALHAPGVDKGIPDLARGVADLPTMAEAARMYGLPTPLLGALGLRESGFRNIPQIGGGYGYGNFQEDLVRGIRHDPRDLATFPMQAMVAGEHLAGDRRDLESHHVDPARETQSLLAAYHWGTGRKGRRQILDYPETMDQGTEGNNYSASTLDLARACFAGLPYELTKP